jgi:fibronectin-binding autotransporter adhesin
MFTAVPFSEAVVMDGPTPTPQSPMTTKARPCLLFTIALFALLAFPRQTSAADGSWTNTSNSFWSDAASWTNAVIADGAGSAADFSQLDLIATLSVALDANHNVGNLIFGDTDTNTAFGIDISAGGGALTLSSPAIVSVSPLGAASFAQITPVIVGTSGLVKSGNGELRLGATINQFTGGVTVNGGTLYAVGATSITNQPITLNNGGTLSVNGSLDGPNATTGGYATFIPADAMATLVSRAASGVFRDIGGGVGSTLIISNTAAGGTVSARKDWNFGGAISNLVVKSASRGYFRMLINQTAPAYNAGSLANTWLHLEKITNYVQTGSTGSAVTYGALSGTPDARLAGGVSGAFAEYRIGSLNQDSEFQGSMDADQSATARRGLNLVKIGTGKLTLSGIINNLLGTNVNTSGSFARGGNITISNGVLALINSTTLPPGTNFGFGTGDYYSPITIVAPGRLDVSGYTAGTYASALLQRWQGNGAVVGDMLFGESTAILSPGADLVANTFTFSNNVAITNGTINFDISPSLVSGNDRINVAGAATLDGTAILNVGFLGGASTGAYVVLEAAGGISGSVAGWTVNWAGRGAPPSLAIVGNQLQLTVSAGSAGSVVWRGTVNNNWDANVTSNWFNGVAQDKFFQLDAASFDDAAGVLQTNINLATTLSPSSVTVSNSANAYTFSGPGQIAGGGSLTKDGNGMLTLLTVNSYAGGTTNKGGGGLNFGTFPGAFGSGPIVMQGASLEGTNNLTLANAIQFATGTSNAINANGGGTFLISGAISGGGGIAVFTDQAIKGVDFSGDCSAFSGTLSLADVEPIVFRFRAPNSSSALAKYNLGDMPGTILGTINSIAPAAYQLGELTGGPSSALSGHQSAALGFDVTWEIGALGTSTTFEGVVQDGAQNGGPNKTGLVKVGAGTLSLTGFNTYTGNTTVSNGTLRITQPYLAVGSTVGIATPGQLNLDFGPGLTNVVKALTINGVVMPNGNYGATGSGAANIDDTHFAGAGVLQVGPNASAITATLVSPTQLSLDWLAGQGWRLQNQTNSAATGLSSNWADVPGATPPLTVDIDLLNPTVFYRLVFP